MNKKLDLLSGELVTLECSMTPLKALDDLCERHGVKQTWQEVTPRSGLQFALKKHYPDCLIRAGAGGRWCVVDELVLVNGNDYTVPLEYVIDDDWNVAHTDGGRSRDCNAIETLAREYRGMVVGRRIGCLMTKVLRREFLVTSVRSGVHFVPRGSWEAWDSFARDMDKSTGITVHRIRCGVDAGTAAAVVTTAAADLEARYRDAIRELSELQPIPAGADGRAVANYKRRRAALLKRVDDVKEVAAEIDASFNTGSQLTKQIERDIKAEMAMAVLAFTN
jgi:hypothetical protein